MTTAQNSLDGKWVLITGGAKRIGATVTRRLHEAGANIALHYRSAKDDAEQLQQALNQQRPDSVALFSGDLLHPETTGTLVADVVAHCGRLDVLINNASTFYPTPVGTITEEHWEDLLGTNLKAPLFLSQAAAPALRESNGVIINMVDIHARRPLKDHPVYGPAKAGLAMLTLSLAKDLAPEIRVNGVSPGAILWPSDGMTETAKDSIVSQIPLARAGGPDDIAGAILYLTRDATYVTGQIIAVDGGRSVGW
ncbi:MAG: pteridine reductase [Woeseiaceae bacterium]